MPALTSEEAGGGHGPFAVSAHHRHRPGRERVAGDRARLEVAGGGEMSRLVLAALSHINNGAGTLFDRGERDGGDVAAARLPGVDTTVELAEQRLVSDVAGLADQFGAVVVPVEHEDQRRAVGNDPTEPARELRTKHDRHRAWHM